MAILIRSIYDEHEHERGFESTQPTMTQQHFKDECDINKIMARFQNLEAPLVDPMTPRSGEPMFGDYSDIPDLQTAQNKLIEAQELFMSLPSSIRRRFDNDAVAFVEFCQKEENVKEMQELGLLPAYRYDANGNEFFVRDNMAVYTGRNNRPVEVVTPAEPVKDTPVQKEETKV